MRKEKSQGMLKWSNLIATAATAVLALTALVTVYLTMAAWRVQQETSRPYFILKEPPQVNSGDELSLDLQFSNVGVHPAVNLSSETIVFSEQLTGKPIHHDEQAIVNEIPKDDLTSLIMILPGTSEFQQSNLKPHYLVVDLQYADPILNKSYTQTIYLKWNGIQEGKVQPTVHVLVDEKTKILQYLKKQGINLEKQA